MALHHPLPLVGQNLALLPDGSVDPAHATDCGEACCSIVLSAFGIIDMSPGCVRQSMGKRADLGYTTAQDLAYFLSRFRLPASPVRVGSEAGQQELLDVKGGDYLAICLGTWISPSAEHWMVSGRASTQGVWFSDPWSAQHVLRSWDTFRAQFSGQMVVIHGR